MVGVDILLQIATVVTVVGVEEECPGALSIVVGICTKCDAFCTVQHFINKEA